MNRIAVVLVLAFALGSAPARAQNSVRVSWTASSDAGGNPSLIYNVYRAGSCPGQFSKLDSVPASGTSYLDMNVAVGAVYCYQVTAVLNGVESMPSNQVIAAIPPSGKPETSCRHRGALIGWIRCQVAQPRNQDRISPAQ